jgi:fused signal recognition particle receptor
LFWRRRKEAETEVADRDLEPTIEPSDPDDPLETTPPPTDSEAGDALTPADDAPLDADVEPVVEPEPEPVIEPEPLVEPELVTEPPAPHASPFAQPGWTASSMAAAPADRERLDAGLARSRGGFMARLREAIGEDGDTSWDDIEETLIAGDVGAALAMDVVEKARAARHPEGTEAAVREQLGALLVERDLDWEPRPAGEGQPAVVLVVGVNGTGKTTTIGKLATRYAGEGRSVILAAGDTFRAAAIDQLRIWADRADVPVVAHAPGADPGAVVYDALDAAVAREADLVIADTAGRLHTKSNLMDELSKIRRIVDKRLPGAEPETLFVLDATTGQNGLAQARAFHDAVGLTGIVLTKLDSTAKGGIVFAIEDALDVPVRFVGVGEQVGDLIRFDPDAFVDALFA